MKHHKAKHDVLYHIKRPVDWGEFLSACQKDNWHATWKAKAEKTKHVAGHVAGLLLRIRKVSQPPSPEPATDPPNQVTQSAASMVSIWLWLKKKVPKMESW